MVDHSRLQHTEKPTNKLVNMFIFLAQSTGTVDGVWGAEQTRTYFVSRPKCLHAAAAPVFLPSGPPPFLGDLLGDTWLTAHSAASSFSCAAARFLFTASTMDCLVRTRTFTVGFIISLTCFATPRASALFSRRLICAHRGFFPTGFFFGASGIIFTAADKVVVDSTALQNRTARLGYAFGPGPPLGGPPIWLRRAMQGTR